MIKFESLCRALRDLGIFLLGVAAIAMTVHYLFIRTDFQTEMQKITEKHFLDGMKSSLAQEGKR